MGKVGAKAHRLARDTTAHQILQPDKGAAADEQDVSGIDLKKFLLRMLAAAFGRYTRHRALDDLEQCLLHAFTRDVTGDRWIVTLARDLVDLVDIYDATLAALDIVIGILQQRQDDVLDVFANVAGLGQRGGIRDGERDLEK